MLTSKDTEKSVIVIIIQIIVLKINKICKNEYNNLFLITVESKMKLLLKLERGQ